MKCFFTLFVLLLFIANTNGSNYYLSNSGNDNNNGTSSTSPWKTLSKLNNISFTAGDTVFLKSGDVFRGKITISQGGNSSKQVVFTSYGTGNKPEISGAETVTNWNNLGTYYQTSFTQAVTHFFINDQEQTLARYPNNHQYLNLDDANTFYLKDASLSTVSTSLISGAKLCIHTAQWCWEKTAVSSYANNQINYTTTTQLEAMDNYGYFLYDNLSHLDTANEWKYDNTTQKISYMPPSGQNPNSLNCEASVYTNGIEINSNASYISIINLAFEKQSNSGIEISSENNKYIKINNCYFARQYNYGVHDNGKYNEIYNSFFREIDGIAIAVDGVGSNSTIHHDTFRNIGPFRNGGIGKQINLTAIMCIGTNNNYIHHNDIDSAGYCGISADGSYNTIERNIIKNVMLINNDGAALKSYGAISFNNIFRNNFVSSSDGNTEGTYNPGFITPAIYLDYYSNNCTIEENTIYNRTQRGIFLNSGTSNNTVKENVVYGGNYCLDINGSQQTSTPITGINVKHNSFFALDNNAYIIKQVDLTNTFNQGILDSNYYFQPYNSNKYVCRIIGTTPTPYTFSAWQATGNDLHTKSSFVSWGTSTNNSVLFMNPTDNDSSINLGGIQYQDLDGNYICQSILLAPYTSKILISTGSTCLSADVTITQTSGSNPSCSNTSVTFTASQTNGGSNPSYQWKVDGTNVGTNSTNYTTSSLNNGQIVSCIMTSNLSGVGNNPATSNSITMSVIAAVTPSISIAQTSGTNPSCTGSSVSFTASTTNGGNNPSYQWKVNGVNAGSNSATYSTSSLTNGQIINCVLTSNESCLTTSSATSNSITMSVIAAVTPSISIAQTSGTNPSCTGSSVTFTASTTNGGSNPSYQWKINGVNAGSNSATQSTSSLTNGQTVSCVLTSNESCLTTSSATSNSITMSVSSSLKPSVAIAITSGSNPSVKGTAVGFTANPTNGGTNPTYQWKINNSTVGSNSSSYTTSTLTNGQSVKCILTSNLSCASSKKATSNSIVMTITNFKSNTSTVSNTVELSNAPQLLAYPNPNDGNFNISFSIASKTSFMLELRNVAGQLVYQESFTDFSGEYAKQMDISSYGKGLYILSLRDENNISIKNLIVY